MKSIELVDLEHWTSHVLVRAGLTQADADQVVANLAFAEARGVRTHGLLRLPTYVNRVRAGGINREAKIHIESDLGALAIVDADNAPGACSGTYGCDLAVERAQRFGIGCVIARNASHFGASAYYTNRIADHGLLGVAACNTESVMCAPSGGAPVLGTNPLAVAVPLPSSERPQLDMATTTASQGKLLVAAQVGESIPPGWAVDSEGHPTTSPTEGLAGALLPSGGPKGFGLAFAIDALLALAGANISVDAAPLDGDASRPQRVGHLFLAIRADAGESLDQYQRRINQLVRAVHSSGMGDTPPPLVPGEPELARTRCSNGRVELPDALLRSLRELASTTGIPLPAVAHDPVVRPHQATRNETAGTPPG
jgi:LDH2 family malate/lactate/ureidoglycolate dehydrogenase